MPEDFSGHIWITCGEAKCNALWPLRSVRSFTNHLRDIHKKQLRVRNKEWTLTIAPEYCRPIEEEN